MSVEDTFPCHCEERSDAAISCQIASSLRAKRSNLPNWSTGKLARLLRRFAPRNDGGLSLKVSALMLLVFCVSFLSGCDFKLPPMPWDPPPKAEHEEEEALAEESGGAAEIEPVDLSKLLPEAMRTLPYKEVTLPMRDGLKLYGKLYDPALTKEEEDDPSSETLGPGDEETEYEGPRYPLVILIHGLGRNQLRWHDLPATLVKAGYSVLAVDLRGHGKSTRLPRGRRTSWRLMEKADWALLPLDVEQAIRFFQKKPPEGEMASYPEVDATDIALIGERLGAGVAAYVSRRNPQSIKAMALLSPRLNDKGFDTAWGLVGFSNPLLICVGEDDPDARQAAEHLYNNLNTVNRLYVYKTGQGAELLQRTAAGGQIRDWLLGKLPTPLMSAPPLPEDAKPPEEPDPNAAKPKPVAKPRKPVYKPAAKPKPPEPHGPPVPPQAHEG